MFAVTVTVNRTATVVCAVTITGSISASPTACPLRGYGHAGDQNDRLSPKPLRNGHAVGDAEIEPVMVTVTYVCCHSYR